MAADTLTNTLDGLIQCVVDGLSAIDRPVCDHGSTVGPPVEISFGQCCECDTEGTSGQVTGFLERVFPADGQTLEQVTRPENCKPGVTAADFTIVVTRCHPTVDEGGNMPDLSQTTEAADNLHTDVSAAWLALKCCGTLIVFREVGIDSDPEGGCSAFGIRVTVPVNLAVTTT